MRKKKALLTSLILSAVLIFGCEKEIEVAIPYAGDKYVVYGELPLGEPVSIYVTKTSAVEGILDFEVALESLTVILYENDTIMDTLKLVDNTVFKSDFLKKTQLGKSYFVSIFDINGELIAQTQSQTPTKVVEELLIEVKSENIKGLNAGVAAKEVIIFIKDQNSENNYYSFDMTAYTSGERSGITTFAIGKNPEIKDDCGYFFRQGYVFNDKCFIKGTSTISHGMELRSYDKSIERSRVPDSVVVTFKTIDKYFYDYFTTIKDASLFENAFVSPKQLKSNMRKGLGIWSPVNTRRFVYVPDVKAL